MKKITTNLAKGLYWAEESFQAEEVTDCMHVVNVHPDVTYQSFQGFGGAFTEASAHVYGQMGSAHKKEIIEACYGDTGLRYTLGRIHMNSCDFALGNYTYIKEGDDKLESFDISHDTVEIIPMIEDAKAAAGCEISLLVSPWSPPPFMKTNGEMNHGGKLKTEYYDCWARYFVKFIKEYQKKGLIITSLTVQNEPMAVQTWDSCVYTSQEESLFVSDYLGPEMEKAGLSDIKIFVWDHNKEEAYNRFREIMENQAAGKYIAGEAIHWYTGDHFEGIELVKKMYPDKEVIFTEGCVEYSRFADTNAVQKAEMYAKDIIGNLNAGISASLDWNLVLDHKGGPNHVGNFCEAPIMCNYEEDTFEKRLPYYYIGQFSRYIKPGAVKIGTTKYTEDIKVTGFKNPDGEKVIVVLNTTNEEKEVTIREDGKGISCSMDAHSITTFIYK